MMQYQIIPVTSLQQNCSLVWCSQTAQAVLIDPGGEADKLITLIEQKKVLLNKILLTHGHLDHIGAAVKLAQYFKVSIYGPHKADQPWFEGLPVQSQMFGWPECPVFLPHHWLEEEQTISFGEQYFSVLHCPGHTPGHIVFVNQENKLAFVGDVIFYDAVGRTDFPLGDQKQLLNSIKLKLLVLDDDLMLIPGHGPTSTIGREKRCNPFLI